MKWFILCLCFTSSLSGKFYQETELWGKPCIDDNSKPSPGKSAEEVVTYTEWIIEQLDSYKDDFIQKLEKHHGSFHELIQFIEHQNKEWLRNFYWFVDEILPINKLLGIPLDAHGIENVKAKIKFNSLAMTKINAALKFILGTLYKITKLDMYADLLNIDLDLKRSIRESMRIIRSITCSMNNYMKTKNYEIEFLHDDFLPKNMTYSEVGLMLRDTFNYFEYIKQLFEALKLEEYYKNRTDRLHEPELWANPCHYSPPISYYFNKSLGQNDWKPDPEKEKELALHVAAQATKAYENGIKLRDEYAEYMSNYRSFNEALQDSREDEWLRKLPWYRDEVLPERKQLFSEINYDYLSNHLMKVFPEVLPRMHKGAKMILSGLDRIIHLKLYNNKDIQPVFHEKFENYSKEFQRFLCLFSDFLRARGQEQLWLFEETRISDLWVFTIYRDSLNYLSYIYEVFEYIARHHAAGLPVPYT